MTGVEGWQIHGRATRSLVRPGTEALTIRARSELQPSDFATRADFDAEIEAADLIYAGNRAVGVADISDETALRVLDLLRRMP